jgi:hypothetical protein
MCARLTKPYTTKALWHQPFFFKLIANDALGDNIPGEITVCKINANFSQQHLHMIATQ